MNRKNARRRAVTDPSANEALNLFEELSILIDQQGIALDRAPTLPALPLASLLEQCESFVDNISTQNGHFAMLWAMPGAPELSRAWWASRFPAVGVWRMSAKEDDSAGLANWMKQQRAAQRPFVVIATPDIVLPTELRPDAEALLLRHPYKAFHTATLGGTTLTSFCEKLAEQLAHLEGIDSFQSDGSVDVYEWVSSALGLPRSLQAGSESLAPEIGPIHVPPYFNGGKSYETLCERLGYEADRLPEPSARAPEAPVLCSSHNSSSPERPAVISTFLERAARLYSAYNPDSPPLDLSAVRDALDHCATDRGENFLDTFDRVCDQLTHIDQGLAHLAAAEHFSLLGERMNALSFIGSALSFSSPKAPWLSILAAAAYANLNVKGGTLRALAADALASDVLDTTTKENLFGIVTSTAGEDTKDHGHSLLLSGLSKEDLLHAERTKLLVEIGTTRELVPGQGSTQKLAQFCFQNGLDFLTVDMDPRNTRNAARMFFHQGLPFKAVCAKGEDFLKKYDGVIDYIFLDAYDFDHGNHSEVRQDRYVKFLGSRIDEIACHEMHLLCAKELKEKLAPDGLICFDDTWVSNEGTWTAKGTLAMPYLLENGFAVISEKNNAALLRRARKVS
ncbi:hypothetical protein [Sulfitobacter sp. 15WGC]|uniref:hypothetical protein n=1 Tax=Sulfitobacter sp. 15WGC TaxID=2575437 RepID=UPI0010AD3F8E|nr:hypothetical protein [Sulfitobacter sp. 15WGC]TKA84321.1 hypothetical protein FCK22_16455 [Sulfitobacter sp. 15WGC]